jgi:ADP-ribose pyrophosphatase YjhB (NUDIX family)
MKRDYPDRPIVGVGAVIVEDGRVLIVRRARPPLQGEWSLPGGVVELGETLRAAAEREALEETGLIVKATELLEVVDRIIPGEDGNFEYHYVLVDFLCHRTGGSLKAASDVSEVRWASQTKLREYGLEQMAIDVVGKAFELSKKDH